MLLFASLLLIASCGGGEEGESPSGAPEETTPPNTTAPAVEPEAAQVPTVSFVKASDKRVEVAVEIAATRTEQARRLMERTELAEDAGMLFVLKSEQSPGFYTENTLIPLSIAFMDSEGRIVDIQDM